MESTKCMTGGNPLRLILFFALPMMLGNVFQQLYTTVDTLIVGRGVGMNALAALGTVDWLSWAMFAVSQGITQGFCVRVAQKYGEEDYESLRRTVALSARISVEMSVAGTLLGLLLLRPAMALLRVPEALYSMARIYAVTLTLGLPCIIFYNYGASVLRAVGNSRTPLWAMILSSLLNILLDCVAVFQLHWGIGGAAAATVFSQLVAGLICARRMAKIPVLRFSLADLRGQGKLHRELYLFGAPIAGKNMVIFAGGLVIQSVVDGFDLAFIAGFTTTNKLYGLLEIAAISYGYAVSTYVGQNFGAGNLYRVRRGMRSATLLSLVTAGALATVLVVFGRSITGLFIAAEDPAVAALAANTAYEYLCCMAFCMPILYLLYAFQSALQGLSRTGLASVSGVVELCTRVSLALTAAYVGIARLLFIAEVMSWITGGVFLLLVYAVVIRRLRKSGLYRTEPEGCRV